MSTPIETNTEELQEVLQQVYNLPSRSGGSTTPDLVLSFDGVASSKDFDSDVVASDFAIKSGSASDTYTKLKNREEVKVVLEFTTAYSGALYTGFVYPVLVSAEESENYNWYTVAVVFFTDYVPGWGGKGHRLSMRIGIDGTITAVTATNM